MSVNSLNNAITDSELWEKLKHGQQDALQTLFYRHYDELYFYGLKICKNEEQTGDAIQEVFAMLWEKRKSLSEVAFVKAYLFKILRNYLLKTRSRIVVNSLFPEQEEQVDFGFELSQEDYIIEQENSTERAQIIEKLLKELSPKQRELIYLRFYCNLSIAEIAEAQNMEKQSVSNTLQRGLKVLRTKFNNFGLVVGYWFFVAIFCRWFCFRMGL